MLVRRPFAPQQYSLKVWSRACYGLFFSIKVGQQRDNERPDVFALAA